MNGCHTLTHHTTHTHHSPLTTHTHHTPLTPLTPLTTLTTYHTHTHIDGVFHLHSRVVRDCVIESACDWQSEDGYQRAPLRCRQPRAEDSLCGSSCGSLCAYDSRNVPRDCPGKAHEVALPGRLLELLGRLPCAAGVRHCHQLLRRWGRACRPSCHIFISALVRRSLFPPR